MESSGEAYSYLLRIIDLKIDSLVLGEKGGSLALIKWKILVAKMILEM